jgi:hypothetical protein
MKKTITALGAITIFLGALGIVAVFLGASITALVDEAESTAPPVVEKPAAIAHGCIRHADKTASRTCDVVLNGAAGTSVCVFSDGTVCLNACDPCARQVDGKWVQVDGWRDE